MEARKVRVTYMGLGPLSKRADEDNAKDHDIGGLEASMARWGFTEPITLNEHTGNMLAGHGRVETLVAMKAAGKKAPHGIRVAKGGWYVPVLRGITLKDRDEVRAYLVAVNKLTESGGWSLPKLSSVLDGLVKRKVQLEGTGFSMREAQRIVARGVTLRPREVPLPPTPKQIRPKLGDVWQLGQQRLACGDARDRALWERVFVSADITRGELLADLLMGDPPYGMNKGFDSDNLQASKLDLFQLEWWEAVRPWLQENASVYVWGNAEDLWRWWWLSLRQWLEQREQVVTFNNEIVWDKEFGSGQGTAAIRSYPMLSERALFFALGRQGFGNKNNDRYWEGWDEIRLYLVAELESAELNAKRLKKLTGVNMHSHWFGKSQWTFIPENHYATLQNETGKFKRPHAELAKLYERLLKRFNEWLEHERAYFDATHDTSLSEVWRFPRVEKSERFEHATPKPIDMMVRILRSSLRPGGLALEPFGGTGPLLLAAEQTGRRCFTVELDPVFCEVILQRWEGLTGMKAQRLETTGGG